MKRIINHLKTYVLRGLLATIPLILTIFVIQLLYVGIDKRVMSWIDQFIGFTIPGLGFFLVAATLYTVGLVASRMIGKQLFNWLERVTNRIPLINTTYKIDKGYPLPGINVLGGIELRYHNRFR